MLHNTTIIYWLVFKNTKNVDLCISYFNGLSKVQKLWIYESDFWFEPSKAQRKWTNVPLILPRRIFRLRLMSLISFFRDLCCRNLPSLTIPSCQQLLGEWKTYFQRSWRISHPSCRRLSGSYWKPVWKVHDRWLQLFGKLDALAVWRWKDVTRRMGPSQW